MQCRTFTIHRLCAVKEYLESRNICNRGLCEVYECVTSRIFAVQISM